MKRKITMSLLFCLSLLTMLLPWFGKRGIQEIYGICLLHNPIAVTCIILTIVGIWGSFEHCEVIANIGFIGMITMEIYEFLTWHILTITGKFDLSFSFAFCYPEYYFALVCMIMTFVIYKMIMKKQAVRLF